MGIPRGTIIVYIVVISEISTLLVRPLQPIPPTVTLLSLKLTLSRVVYTVRPWELSEDRFLLLRLFVVVPEVVLWKKGFRFETWSIETPQ